MSKNQFRLRTIFIRFVTIFIIFSFHYPSVTGQIRILFRYDDFTLTPSNIADSLISIFQKRNIPLCLGIIPFDTSSSIINELDQEQIIDLRSRIQKKEIEVALHGFKHTDDLKDKFFCKKQYSEFASLDYISQYEKIKKGKLVLDSILQTTTQIFIPPFNTYDKTTLEVLEDLGFDIISASMYGLASSNKLKYIPETCYKFAELPWIINKNINNDVTIIFLFHPSSLSENSPIYSNNLTNTFTLGQLDSTLSWIKKQNTCFPSFSDLGISEDFNKSGYKLNSLQLNFLKKILNKLKLYRYGIYLSMDLSKRNKLFLFFGNILLHVISFTFTYILFYLILNLLNLNFKSNLALLVIISIPILVYLYYIRYDFSVCIIFIFLFVNFVATIFALIHYNKNIDR